MAYEYNKHYNKPIVYGSEWSIDQGGNIVSFGEEIQGIVHSLKQKEIGVLITDHNVRETLSITDRSYLLFDGQILKSGSSEFLANDEEARRLYLGEKFKLD